MARIEIDVDDELLGQAAHALGTRGAEETVRAALAAAVEGIRTPPPLPGRPGPGREDPFAPVDPTVAPPQSPHRPPPDFPFPPEVR